MALMMNFSWFGLIPLMIWIPVSGAAQTLAHPMGTIQGIVVDSETGKPLAGASVNLDTLYHVYGRQGVASVGSNGSGLFTIRAAPNEYYYLSARKGGYLHDEAVPEPNQFSLDAGEKLTSLVLKLTPEGVIRGRLADANGDLVARGEISIWQWRFAGGERYLARRNSGAQLSPDGSFLIDNLRPGSVYLQASRTWEPADHGSQPRIDASAPTFYRSAANAASAEPIRIVPGAVIDGIELRMRRDLLYRVGGIIAGPAGMEQQALSLCATSRPRSCPAIMVRPDGRFSVDNVPAGEYEIEGNALMRKPRPQSLQASELVSVSQNLRGVRLDFYPTPQVKSIIHRGQGWFQLFSIPEHTYAADLRYDYDVSPEPRSVPVYPGEYRVVPVKLPEEIYVESILSEGKDVSFGFRLSTSGVTLDILLAPGAATVSGTVRDGQGRPLDEVPVTIWTKADGLRGFARTTISEQDGSYKLTNLPPGEYWVAAWQGISAGIAEYRGFFESFGKGAKPVKLAAGARLETDLTAIGEKAAAEQAGKLQ